jgi:RNA-directed DNA polymerase
LVPTVWSSATASRSPAPNPPRVICYVGGVISPVLLNVALHGMEQAAGVRYRNSARSDAETVSGSPVLVGYADDYVAMCDSRQQAEQVKARLAAWLEPRGLRLNEDKTHIVHVEDGFSFLGFSIRRYVDRRGSGKLLIKPAASR